MEKKKRNKKLLILVFVFVAVLIVGVVGLLIPQKVSDYLFYNVDFSRHTGMDRYGFDASFTIENKGNEELDNALVTIEYTVEHGLDTLEYETTITQDLDQGDNQIEFVHEETGFGVYLLGEIENITISVDGKTYEVQDKDSIGRPNWAFIACSVIGFIGGAVSFVVWLTSNKVFVNPAVEGLRNFEERIKEAFKPAEPVEKKSERITCHYCKCKYDADNHSKCPNCGAPPEPKD